jgi:hypothetical protein
LNSDEFTFKILFNNFYFLVHLLIIVLFNLLKTNLISAWFLIWIFLFRRTFNCTIWASHHLIKIRIFQTFLINMWYLRLIWLRNRYKIFDNKGTLFLSRWLWKMLLFKRIEFVLHDSPSLNFKYPLFNCKKTIGKYFLSHQLLPIPDHIILSKYI